jgi:hypothetical protein
MLNKLWLMRKLISLNCVNVLINGNKYYLYWKEGMNCIIVLKEIIKIKLRIRLWKHWVYIKSIDRIRKLKIIWCRNKYSWY